jgi:hypothetical protein
VANVAPRNSSIDIELGNKQRELRGLFADLIEIGGPYT